MVKGLQVFNYYFKNHSDKFTIIGGTACHINRINNCRFKKLVSDLITIPFFLELNTVHETEKFYDKKLLLNGFFVEDVGETPFLKSVFNLL